MPSSARARHVAWVRSRPTPRATCDPPIPPSGCPRGRRPAPSADAGPAPDDARPRSPGYHRGMPRHSLMTVHAHPDDETIGTGGVMARYSRAGDRVVCVTCTGGEEGEIVVPEMD